MQDEDELRGMKFDPRFEGPLGNNAPVGPRQVSLLELFFVTTLAAVALGVFIYISQLLAMLVGSGLIVTGVVKWSGIQHLILGGLLGFTAAAIMVCVIVLCLQPDTATSIGLALFCPAAGYIGGCCLAELSNNDLD